MTTTQPPDPLTDLDALLTGVVTVDRLPFLLPVVPCVVCGEDSDEGPVASNGDHWCGECYREGEVAP